MEDWASFARFSWPVLLAVLHVSSFKRKTCHCSSWEEADTLLTTIAFPFNWGRSHFLLAKTTAGIRLSVTLRRSWTVYLSGFSLRIRGLLVEMCGDNMPIVRRMNHSTLSMDFPADVINMRSRYVSSASRWFLQMQFRGCQHCFGSIHTPKRFWNKMKRKTNRTANYLIV